MVQSLPEVWADKNFAVVHLGPFTELRQFAFATPKFPREVEGKVFLKQLLNLTGAEISLNNLPAGKSVPFYHKHQLNEEIYIFVQGQGEFQVDGQIFPVHQGSIVRVAPEGERCLRNVSDRKDLCWVVIQARAGSYSDHTIEDGVGVAKKVTWVSKHSQKVD
jgi:mannose-6-phosphate isomerase-like protein (cupin superfamily)